jgi:hypothetical protein
MDEVEDIRVMDVIDLYKGYYRYINKKVLWIDI